MRFVFICFILSTSLFMPVANAQQVITEVIPEQVLLFGNEQQAGYTIHVEVVHEMDNDQPLNQASETVIDKLSSEGDTRLNATTKRVMAADKAITLSFVSTMVTLNNLFETTKTTIETFPDDTIDIMTLAVTLYPNFAQEIVDAAAMTGEITPEEALLAAIAAGADPTTVSAATAAGGNVNVTATPTGTGIGAGGAGGGDTTASSN